MADAAPCYEWKQELGEKQGYLETWKGRLIDATNALDSAFDARTRAQNDLEKAQGALESAAAAVSALKQPHDEAIKWVSDLTEACKALEAKIDANC